MHWTKPSVNCSLKVPNQMISDERQRRKRVDSRRVKSALVQHHQITLNTPLDWSLFLELSDDALLHCVSHHAGPVTVPDLKKTVASFLKCRTPTGRLFYSVLHSPGRKRQLTVTQRTTLSFSRKATGLPSTLNPAQPATGSPSPQRSAW